MNIILEIRNLVKEYPGVRAVNNVSLQIEQRADVLTLPRTAIQREHGKQFVRVSRGGTWADQKIRTGWRTDRRVEILDGLTDGEIVQLNQE